MVDKPRLSPVVLPGGSGRVWVDGHVSVHERDSINMTCKVDAVPAPSSSDLTWYMDGSLVHTGQYFSILSVQRRDAGQYHCQASNTMTPSHGSSQTAVGQATFSIVVMCKKPSLYTSCLTQQYTLV